MGEGDEADEDERKREEAKAAEGGVVAGYFLFFSGAAPRHHERTSIATNQRINKVGEIDKATRITPNQGSSVARFSATIAHAPTLGPPIASACHVVYFNAIGTNGIDIMTYSAAMESTVNQYRREGQDEWEPDMSMLTVMTDPRIIHTQWMTSM